MHKHIALLARREGMSHEEFVTHWREQYTPLVREMDVVVRYHTLLPPAPDASEFDGLAERYFETLDALHESLAREETSDEVHAFLDVDRCRRFVGREVVEKDETGGDTTGLYKHSAFLVRKEGLSHDEFLDHWANTHVPLAREIPGVVRYTRVVPADPESTAFDGVAELSFESLDALRAGLGHESSRDYDPDHPKARAPRADVDNFLSIGDRPRFVGRERVEKDGT
jgi:uncharacterized protein (TIGR02118 family)